MDGKPYGRNKATISNFSCVVGARDALNRILISRALNCVYTGFFAS